MAIDPGVDFGYFSHHPVLAACIYRTSGPILELGAGWGSTVLIHYASRDRFVLTADSDAAWLRLFADSYGCPRRHQFEWVKQSDDVRANIEAWKAFVSSWASAYPWGVAFVDCAQGESRGDLIAILKGRARFIVAHDWDDHPRSTYGWRKVDGLFKHVSVMKRLRPWTAVLSDDAPFPLEACDR